MHAYDDTEAAVVSERLNNFSVKILLFGYDKIFLAVNINYADHKSISNLYFPAWKSWVKVDYCQAQPQLHLQLRWRLSWLYSPVYTTTQVSLNLT